MVDAAPVLVVFVGIIAMFVVRISWDVGVIREAIEERRNRERM